MSVFRSRLRNGLESTSPLLFCPPFNGDRSSMVELQIVVLAVAGSSPVDHPPSPRLGRGGPIALYFGLSIVDLARVVARPLLKGNRPMNHPVDPFGQSEFHVVTPTFWKRFLSDEELRECDNLEKLLAGCEIIAALDGRDLLAA